MTTTHLGLRVARATIWSIAAHVVSLVVIFGGLAVLARILSPGDFGVVAMATAVTGLFEVTRDLGLGSAMIYHAGHRDDSDPIFSTGLLLSMAVASAIAAALLVGAPLAGAFYQDDEVISLLRLLAVYFFIGGFGTAPDVLLRQRLAFGRRFWPQIAAPIGRYLVAIALATAGWGASSLVIGQVAGMTLSVLLGAALAGWWPRARVRMDLIGDLLKFGGQNTIISLLAAIILNADSALVGRFLGSADLGLYTLAFKVPDSTLVAIPFVLSNVLYPTYVRLGNADGGLRTPFLQAYRFHALILSPMAGGIGILAPFLVPFLFGEQWSAATMILQLLTAASFLRGMAFSAGAVFVAGGRPSLLIVDQVIWTLVMVPITYLTAQISIAAVGGAQIVAAVAYVVATVYLLRRMILIRWSDLIALAAPSIAATALMVFVVWGTLELLGTSTPAVGSIVGVTIGGVVYLIAIARLDPFVRGQLATMVDRAAQRAHQQAYR
jgi:PST family polysaccharide transporter